METFIGTDIIEVKRIENAMQNKAFIERVFTEKEINYCETKNEDIKYQHYAARFSAKEAIFKALSKKVDSQSISWKNIEITNEENGRPVANLIDMDIKCNIDVSLSHIKEYATASAVVTID